jgi:hypothetical protein
VNDVLFNVCPNCGGGFEKRPTRPKLTLAKNPVSTKEHFKPLDKENFKIKLEKYRELEPRER